MLINLPQMGVFGLKGLTRILVVSNCYICTRLTNTLIVSQRLPRKMKIEVFLFVLCLHVTPFVVFTGNNGLLNENCKIIERIYCNYLSG